MPRTRGTIHLLSSVFLCEPHFPPPAHSALIFARSRPIDPNPHPTTIASPCQLCRALFPSVQTSPALSLSHRRPRLFLTISSTSSRHQPPRSMDPIFKVRSLTSRRTITLTDVSGSFLRTDSTLAKISRNYSYPQPDRSEAFPPHANGSPAANKSIHFCMPSRPPQPHH